MKILDERKPFIIESVWLEKNHASQMDTWGHETFFTNDTSFHFVRVMAKNSYFRNDDFLNHWIIVDEQGQSVGLDGHTIFLDLKDNHLPNKIRFKAYIQKQPHVSYVDTVKIAEFILKKSS